MRGLITFKEVFSNLGLIRREFGFSCLYRCLQAALFGRQTTFLQVAVGRDWHERK